MKTLFIDGLVYPMDNNDECFKYLGIEDDRIIYIGNEYPIIHYDKIISIKDKFIYPTLTDSHLHLLYTIILSANSFDICKIENGTIQPNDLKGIEKLIREYALKHKKNKLIIVNQYIAPAIKENRLPSSIELDAWTDSRDIVVFSIDGHSASLSSSLLNKLCIESKNGILSGEAYDMNQGKITSYIAKSVSLTTLINGIVNFTNNALKYGITKVCALDGEDNGTLNDTLLSLLVFIARRLEIDVRLFPEYHNYQILEKIKNKMKHKRIGGCSKWEIDGSVGSHSAAFYYAYKDTNTISDTYYKKEYVIEKIKEALDGDITFTCHAIGTRAIDTVVNAYKDNKDLIKDNGPMNRIDHFEFPSNDAIDFVSNNRIAVTFQPGYSYIDKHYIHSYTKHLDENNLNNLAKLKDLVKRNILILGSSDSPVQSINPYDQMYGMTNYYLENESISNYEAFKTYTTNASIALDEEEGVLKVGSISSFMISKFDIINMDKSLLNKIEIEQVYIKGKLKRMEKARPLYLLKLLLKKPHKI